MDKPSAEDIIKAIRASGYLTEQEVATTLESLGFYVETNWAYQDVEEAKSREVDVRAVHRKYFNEESRLAIFAEILCECKNSSNPFVFLSRKKTVRDDSLIPEEYVFSKRKFNLPTENKPNSFRVVPAFSHLKLAASNYRFQRELRAVQFAKIVRDKKSWQASHAGLYDAVFYPLVKALMSRRKELSGYSNHFIWLFFPIVVTTGELFDVDTSEAEMSARPVEHISMLRSIKSKAVDGIFNIDFVTQRGLPDFVKTKLNPFCDVVLEIAKDEPLLLK